MFQYTENLAQYLEKVRDLGENIPEETVWRTLHDVTKTAGAAEIDVLDPFQLRVTNGRIFCRLPLNATSETDTRDSLVVSHNRTAVYAAPEILNKGTPSESTLSWSLGYLAHEMATLEPAFCDRQGTGNKTNVIAEIMQGLKPQNSPEHYSNNLRNIIDKCLQFDPHLRPTMQEIQATAREHIS